MLVRQIKSVTDFAGSMRSCSRRMLQVYEEVEMYQRASGRVTGVEYAAKSSSFYLDAC